MKEPQRCKNTLQEEGDFRALQIKAADDYLKMKEAGGSSITYEYKRTLNHRFQGRKIPTIKCLEEEK